MAQAESRFVCCILLSNGKGNGASLHAQAASKSNHASQMWPFPQAAFSDFEVMSASKTPVSTELVLRACHLTAHAVHPVSQHGCERKRAQDTSQESVALNWCSAWH